mgnify:CR=1 FL=1
MPCMAWHHALHCMAIDALPTTFQPTRVRLRPRPQTADSVAEQIRERRHGRSNEGLTD